MKNNTELSRTSIERVSVDDVLGHNPAMINTGTIKVRAFRMKMSAPLKPTGMRLKPTLEDWRYQAVISISYERHPG